jgi:hypothetical protein
VQEASAAKAKDVFSMLAVAKSLPDALKIVTKPRTHSEDSAEDGVMQCFIGLDGSTETVSISQGMTMTKLKKKVEKLTGIPVSEQKYVFADNAELVGGSDPVPTNATLRCVRSQSDDEQSDASQKDEQVAASEDETDNSSEVVGEQEICNGDIVVPSSKERLSWADLIDEEPFVTKEDTPIGETCPSVLARIFTDGWRAWDEQERQHQFHIAVPEYAREGICLVEQIKTKTAASRTYGPNIVVRLRGRGSGFLELPRQGRKERESTDPLMICLSGRPPYSIDAYWQTFYRVATLLEEVYATYNQSLLDQGMEVHVTDDWVHGGVRPHGIAEPSRTISSGCSDWRTSCSDANSEWAREFTENWRKWDESERQHQFYIALPEHRREEFQVAKRIKFFCRDNFMENIMLRCRGRGSGFVEGKHKAESSDPMMICLSGRKEKYILDDYWDIFYKLSSFLQALYADYNDTVKRKCQEVHLVYRDVHGGARIGARINP